jgi:hypothetical protein
MMARTMGAEKRIGSSHMAIPKQVGAHWALVETEKQPGADDRWKARWAVYADEAAAMLAEKPDPLGSLVSGSTAIFDTEGEALLKGEEDATRSEAVLSGTYTY